MPKACASALSSLSRSAALKCAFSVIVSTRRARPPGAARARWRRPAAAGSGAARQRLRVELEDHDVRDRPDQVAAVLDERAAQQVGHRLTPLLPLRPAAPISAGHARSGAPCARPALGSGCRRRARRRVGAAERGGAAQLRRQRGGQASAERLRARPAARPRTRTSETSMRSCGSSHVAGSSAERRLAARTARDWARGSACRTRACTADQVRHLQPPGRAVGRALKAGVEDDRADVPAGQLEALGQEVEVELAGVDAAPGSPPRQMPPPLAPGRAAGTRPCSAGAAGRRRRGPCAGWWRGSRARVKRSIRSSR